MAQLVDKYYLKVEELMASDKVWGRDDPNIELCNVFEPTCLAVAFESDHIDLGHLVFGTDLWISFECKSCVQDDPITVLYRKWSDQLFNLLSTPTMLNPDLPQAVFCGKQSSPQPIFLFHGLKEIWSITDNFPANSQWSNFSTVTVCKGNPAIPRFYEECVLCSLNCIGSHLNMEGKRKQGRSNKQNQQLAKKLSKVTAGYERAGMVEEVVDEESPQPPLKNTN
ncbi:hypothetical protein C8R43DRAFT_965680 [Mycena crocata]|nr:hypothetical protein C8R43DRAFT_965680 [Mycena crocata]